MGDWLANLDHHWWWVGAGALLGILEILLPGIFLIWVALAAWITALIAWLVPLSLAVQLVIFVALAFVIVWAGRHVYARNPVESADPNLNVRTSRLIGQVVTVESAIESGKGRVRVGDGVWNASGPDAPSGAKVRIVAADGALLTVELA
ncbi:MAG TPA: NfeD family protein [Allosphingosinicella sp.]|nr:NfeD family protein [Allosphingosinicella sp.]